MISIILPCYNPPLEWGINVLRSYQLIESRIKDHDLELIIVNDGMPKDFFVSEENFLMQHIPNMRFIHSRINMGKGHALRLGIDISKGDIIMYTDIDFPYTIDSFVEVYQNLLKDIDVVFGVKDAKYYAGVPMARKIISKTLRYIIGVLLKTPITDTQCGLKGMKSEVKSLFLKTTTNRYLFDLEFAKICFRHKPQLNIISKAVTLNDNVVFRKMSPKILIQELGNFVKILIN
jgi:glycosyltransferase involved in cell wall biosynthesis